MDDSVQHAEHFESMARQRLAATLGMWVFLASELLFFGALFTVYAFYRAQAPRAFEGAVATNTLYWGSANTVVLLTSSLLAAFAVHHLRTGARQKAATLAFGTAALGVLFLCVKGYEYYLHFQDGIYPGGQGEWFQQQQRPAASAAFWTLYFMMTGLHAVHVLVGVGILAILAGRIRSGLLRPQAPQALENGAMYWHLVDVIWLFLWPLFYLTGSGR